MAEYGLDSSSLLDGKILPTTHCKYDNAYNSVSPTLTLKFYIKIVQI
jgi:hypothetical protein